MLAEHPEGEHPERRHRRVDVLRPQHRRGDVGRGPVGLVAPQQVGGVAERAAQLEGGREAGWGGEGRGGERREEEWMSIDHRHHLI